MNYFKTKGLIIDKSDIGERDRFYYLLSDDFGKIKLIAKGIRRPEAKFSAYLDLLNFVSVIFINGKNNIITDVVLENQYRDLKNDLVKLNLALNIIGVVNNLIPEQETTTNILPFILNVFNFLQERELKSNIEARFIFVILIFKILNKLGYLNIEKISDLKNSKINAAIVEKLWRQANDFLRNNFNFEINSQGLII